MVEPSVSSARDAVLERVRAAISGAEASSVDRAYRRAGERAHDAVVELFCQRVADYRADVRRTSPERVGASVTAILASARARTVAVPADLPPEWRPAGVRQLVDRGLTWHDLDALDGVVTGSTVAIAESGTIVLSAAPNEGRRALTLVPDLHVCVVEAARIVELLPEAMERLSPLVRAERRPLTFISGPSATSDIELKRVEGVHGPRRLAVVVVEAGAPPGGLQRRAEVMTC